MEILAIAVGRFADANAAGAAKHAIDFSDHPFGLVEVPALFQRDVERDKENDTEGIGPQIPETVRPDALRTHPGKLVDDVPWVLGCCHSLPQSPNG